MYTAPEDFPNPDIGSVGNKLRVQASLLTSYLGGNPIPPEIQAWLLNPTRGEAPSWPEECIGGSKWADFVAFYDRAKHFPTEGLEALLFALGNVSPVDAKPRARRQSRT